MTLPDVEDLRYPDGTYADPVKVTNLALFLNNANSGKVASSLIVKTSPGLVFGLTVSSVAAQFIQLFDTEALPAEGAVPLLSFPVAATSTMANLWLPPRGFRSGIVVCNSSTQHTKTIGSADCIFDVQFL